MAKENRRQVLIEVTIAAPVETVWRALREREQLANWFGWDAETLGGEIDYIFFDHAEADEHRHILTFEPWENLADAFELVARDGTTVLRVVRYGQPDVDWEGTYEDINEGWVNFVQQLRLLLERHPGAGRRTLYLSGACRTGVAEPSRALGLADLRQRPDGAEYMVELPTGETIAGIVWHRTHYQLGLNVTEWGDGLIVVSDMGVSDKRPNGGGSVLLTTFGLDDAAFGELEARWRRWWEAHYEAPATAGR